MPATPSLLLVEDNEDDVFFMRRALQSAAVPLALHVAPSGDDAIAYLGGAGSFSDRTAHPLPLLVLLDLKLPGRDGHEVLRWIRAQPELRALVVIMLTTSKERSDVQRAYELGANSYLVKPASAPQLVEQMQALRSYWLEQNEFAQGRGG